MCQLISASFLFSALPTALGVVGPGDRPALPFVFEMLPNCMITSPPLLSPSTCGAFKLGLLVSALYHVKSRLCRANVSARGLRIGVLACRRCSFSLPPFPCSCAWQICHDTSDNAGLITILPAFFRFYFFVPTLYHCSTRGRGRKATKPAAKQTPSSKSRASKKRSR